MAVYLTKEKKSEVLAQHARSANDTGSAEAQISLFTYRIQQLSDHLRTNKKDHSCRRALLTLVGKRKRLLKYLSDTDLQKYRELIDKLGIRK
ncbi:MAG TPA: 30S ribosomal protein S15 [Saprospiraceae bacterium]|jgi:small subunit ribosomal protein S15|nr:30S ribosomal protein S15 [Saprospiraceae bacterium]HMP14709.1 30S ribosomal protein S15 [Saprospiraceae bacterium]